MSLAQNSVIYQLWLTFRHLFTEKWREGILGHFFARLGEGITSGCSGSAICSFLRRDGIIPRSWPSSMFCRILTVVVNIPLSILRWLYRIGRDLWNGSFLLGIISGLGRGSFLLLGLVMLVMMVAPHDLWDNFYAFVAMLVVTVLFIIGAAPRPRYRLEIGQLSPYFVVFFVFVCYALVCSVVTDRSLRCFFFHLTAFLIVLLLVSAVRRLDELQLVVVLASVGMFVASVYGCYQGYIGVEVDPSQQDMLLNEGMPGRIFGFFDNPNNFAELLVMMIPLDLALLFNAKTWRGRLMAIVALLPCIISIGYTYSRSGWIGLVLAILIFIAFKNWRLVPLVIVLGLLAIPFLPQTIYNRILTIGNSEDSSTNYRFEIYTASKNLLVDYWHRGVGLGNDVMSKVFKQGYPKMFDERYPIHTHNNYLQVWLEMGILGLVSFLGALIYQIKTGIKCFAATADMRVKNLLAGSIAGFCGILVISCVEYTWFYPRNMFVYFFLFGIIGSCIKLVRMEQKRTAR